MHQPKIKDERKSIMKSNKLINLALTISLIALLTACGGANSNSINTPKQQVNSLDHNNDKESYIEINGGSENRKP